MKRFLLFDFPEYYPSGGLSDVVAEFDTEEEAQSYIKDRLKKYGFSDYAYLFDCDKKDKTWRKDE
jgi:hypothetical protein